MSETPVEYITDKSKSISLIEQANNLQVMDEGSFNLAVKLGLELEKEIKQIESKWTPLVKAARIAYEADRNAMKSELEPRCKAQAFLSSERVKYKVEQDRIAQAEQARLEREAYEKAEKERQKLLNKAVQAQTPEKQEELLEKAEQVYAQPVFAESAMPKTVKSESGSITFIKDIEVVVIDPKAVCKAISEGLIPVTCVEFKNLKQWIKLNNIKTFEGLCIKEIQRESKRI